MTAGTEIRLADGRVLVVHDSGHGPGHDPGPRPTGPALLWHHGSPQTGALLEPVLAAARERGVRLVSYGRPGYGGSSPSTGRDVASAAIDVREALTALGIADVVTMGASGGGPHALACAALLPDRVRAVATLAGIAPMTDDMSWFDGMAAPGALQAAREGRAARALFAETDDFDPTSFVAADYAALEGEWAVLGQDVGLSAQWGDDGLVDDDMAFARPWGFDLEAITVPTLVVQGALDRVVPVSHGEQLHRGIRGSELWRREGDGHISVLAAVPAAMDCLLAHAG